jgi:preprotein translocase subunit YajC
MTPHLLIASSLLHAGMLATSKPKTTSSSSSIIFVFIVLAAGGYFLLIRPQRRRAQRMQQSQQSIQIGDEVILTSGIVGRVTWLEGDRARVEIAPNTEIEVLRAAIGRTVPAAVPDEDIASQGGYDDGGGSYHAGDDGSHFDPDGHVDNKGSFPNANPVSAGSPPLLSPDPAAGTQEGDTAASEDEDGS